MPCLRREEASNPDSIQDSVDTLPEQAPAVASRHSENRIEAVSEDATLCSSPPTQDIPVDRPHVHVAVSGSSLEGSSCEFPRMDTGTSNKSDRRSRFTNMMAKTVNRLSTMSIMEYVQHRLQRLQSVNRVVATVYGGSETNTRARFPESPEADTKPRTATPRCGMRIVSIVALTMALVGACCAVAVFILLCWYLDEIRSLAETAAHPTTSGLAEERLQALTGDIKDHIEAARFGGILLCVGAVVFALSVGLGLGCAISVPVWDACRILYCLGKLQLEEVDLQHLCRMQDSSQSRISEMRHLQNAVNRVALSTQMFTRYLPETVVRAIVRCDERATRLHVARREVSIMFSDIRDFTSIAEQLSQKDLIFLLTRYFGVMTRIIESYDGVVAEILGDGLLAFWNTPDDVEAHAAKACMTALAQQEVLGLLNQELRVEGLPSIAIRIGLHSGTVLSGNIGSDTKMKFGCLGDPVNLASRLEGLCKFYGVGVICSAETIRQLPPGTGLFLRELDLVQVKGKCEATSIYEVVGILDERVPDVPVSPTKSVATENRNITWSALRRVFDRGTPSSNAWLSEVLPSFRFQQRSETGADTQASSGVDSTQFGCGCVDSTKRRHVGLYVDAFEAYKCAHFVKAKGLLDTLLAELPQDGAAIQLLARTERHIGEDGKTIVGLTMEELAKWTGVRVMGEK
eukprot:NODE_1394_length_2492_cov_16.658351.p1 GENE.NODE_1394_length_2492_cov_16.658351~~NODE_1394_length_2492_cov_16.658351.p1  ORF type:complete len:687 (+),score=159.74 NODE_1394_length_2492_cov_16.658351:162-2222(+)